MIGEMWFRTVFQSNLLIILMMKWLFTKRKGFWLNNFLLFLLKALGRKVALKMWTKSPSCYGTAWGVIFVVFGADNGDKGGKRDLKRLKEVFTLTSQQLSKPLFSFILYKYNRNK